MHTLIESTSPLFMSQGSDRFNEIGLNIPSNKQSKLQQSDELKDLLSTMFDDGVQQELVKCAFEGLEEFEDTIASASRDFG